MKVLPGSELLHHVGHDPLERGRGSDVDDATADRAQQVVVVLGQILGQLEAGELVVGRDAPHDTGTLEVDKVPVGGAPRDLRKLRRDVGDAHRVAQRRQELHERPPAGGVALVDAAQPDLDDVMEPCLWCVRLRWHAPLFRSAVGVLPPAGITLRCDTALDLSCNETQSQSMLLQ